MFVSDNGDYSSFETGRFSLSNKDYLSKDYLSNSKPYGFNSCASQDFAFGIIFYLYYNE